MKRGLTAAVVLLLAGAMAAPAGAKPKPISQVYDVTAPVPYPMDGTSHCSVGVEGMTRNTREITLPARGVLEIELTGFVGDWVLELFDGTGRLLGQSAMLEPTDTAPVRRLTYKKAVKGQRARIAVCNFAGGPQAKVKYVFTFA